MGAKKDTMVLTSRFFSSSTSFFPKEDDGVCEIQDLDSTR
ncbi:hypothetical protein Tco_0515987, partial [Tanacetum coccineum]